MMDANQQITLPHLKHQIDELYKEDRRHRIHSYIFKLILIILSLLTFAILMIPVVFEEYIEYETTSPQDESNTWLISLFIGGLILLIFILYNVFTSKQEFNEGEYTGMSATCKIDSNLDEDTFIDFITVNIFMFFRPVPFKYPIKLDEQDLSLALWILKETENMKPLSCEKIIEQAQEQNIVTLIVDEVIKILDHLGYISVKEVENKGKIIHRKVLLRNQ